MTREQIEQAAMQSAKEACESFEEAFEYANGFVYGAEWRINSVWHDASEEPKHGRLILCVGVNVYGTILVSSKESFKSLMNDRGVLRWAYISDLLPTKGGR